MKNLIVIVILLSLSCKAQNPIVGLDAPSSTPEGAYYKDLNNELDKFVGTWKYTNGTTVFTIVLQKEEQVQILNDYYDTLKGGYSYTENGVEIVNTLPIDGSSDGNMGGSTIVESNLYVNCDDCAPNERRIKLYFVDSERRYLNNGIMLRYIIDSNPEQMTVTLFSRHGGIKPNEDSPEEPRVPYGEYLMVKQ